MFEENAPGRKIYVPSTSLSAYQNKENWHDYYSDIVGFY